MFFFQATSFIILGIATLWALRVIFGDTRASANSTITLALSIVGWVFILLGVTFLVSPFGIIIALIVFGMTVARYRHGERRALLWTLSLAAEKGMPFAPSVRAFATRRSDEMARRALELAHLLEAGVPLAKALAASGNPLPADTELMVRLSEDSQATAAALRESGEFNDDADQAWTPIFGQLVYLLLVGCCMVLIFAFIMFYVMPTYREIFVDFGWEMPALTRLMIAIAQWSANYSILFLPLLAYFVGVLLVGGFFYARGQIWLPPPFRWLFGRTDKPTLLRGLAVCLEQQMPIHEALRRLGRDYPDKKMQSRLAECAGSTAVEADWCEVMGEQDLISAAEAAVLRSSLQAGSLTWALRELAEVATRRMIYRASAMLNVASAASILLLAVPIALLAVGCFMPLVNLIQEAANNVY